MYLLWVLLREEGHHTGVRLQAAPHRARLAAAVVQLQRWVTLRRDAVCVEIIMRSTVPIVILLIQSPEDRMQQCPAMHVARCPTSCVLQLGTQSAHGPRRAPRHESRPGGATLDAAAAAAALLRDASLQPSCLAFCRPHHGSCGACWCLRLAVDHLRPPDTLLRPLQMTDVAT